MDSTKTVSRHITPNMCFASSGICGSHGASGSSGARNIDALFLLPGWHRYGFHKKCVGTLYAALVFLHPVGSAGHVVLSSASGA
jgi:hypothetical protein